MSERGFSLNRIVSKFKKGPDGDTHEPDDVTHGPEQKSSKQLTTIDTKEAAKILAKTEIHGGEFGGKSLDVQTLAAEGLGPVRKATVEGTEFAFSTPYQVREDRQAAVIYVKNDSGKFVARSYYQSGSQGSWRYLPGYLPDGDDDIAWFDKYVDEKSITAPFAVQKHLAEVAQLHSAKPKKPLAIFAGLAREAWDQTKTVALGVNIQAEKLESDQLQSTTLFLRPETGGKKPPEQLTLAQNRMPDFSRMLDTWQDQNDHYGKMTIEIFQSHDGNLKYMFIRNKKGKVWIGGVENNSQIDKLGLGLRRNWVDPGDLATPAYEYKIDGAVDQTGGYGNDGDRSGSYVDMTKNYLDRIPLIQEYKASLARRGQQVEASPVSTPSPVSTTEQSAVVEAEVKKPNGWSRLRSTVRTAFAKGKNVLDAVAELVKRPFQTPENVEEEENGPTAVADLPAAGEAYIDADEESVETDQNPSRMRRAWDALSRVKNKLATKGKDVASAIKEKKEERSLEYRVRDAISKVITFDLDMVEVESTFEEVLLWKDATGPQQTVFDKVLANLGIPSLDFDITQSATVADLVLAIQTQYPKLSIRGRIEKHMVDSYEKAEREGRVSELSFGTDLQTPTVEGNQSDQEDNDSPEKTKESNKRRRSLRSLNKERIKLQDAYIEIIKKLEADDGLTPDEKAELERRKTELLELIDNTEKLMESQSSGVPWQTMLLSMGASVIARKGLVVAGSTLLGTPAALAVAPAAAAVAAGRDLLSMRGEGGPSEFYQRATQNTMAALTTVAGSEHTGRESEREHDKNRWQGWKRSPLWLLRKVGVVLNIPRSQMVQLAYGVTRDRSLLSKFVTENEWADQTALNEESVINWISENLNKYPEIVMELGRRLNRLAALSQYGALDVSGESGSVLFKVSEDHDATFMRGLHQLLDQVVTDQVATLASGEMAEKWNRFKQEWQKHAGYQSEDAIAAAERSARFKGVAASFLGTLMTAGASATLTYLLAGNGPADIQHGLESLKHHDVQSEIAQTTAVSDGGGVTPELGLPGDVGEGVKQNHEVFLPSVEASSGAAESSAMDSLKGEIAGMKAAANQAQDQVAQAHAAMPVDPGTADMPGHAVEVAHEVAQATNSTMVELHTGLPWTDFKQAVLKLTGVEDVVTPSQLADTTHVAAGTITDGIKDIWKALQPSGLDTDNIAEHTKFLSLAGIQDVQNLPQLTGDAVGYTFSESQLHNLAVWWKDAITAAEPNELQQIARDLNGLETGVPMLSEELAKNPDQLQQFLDVANGVISP